MSVFRFFKDQAYAEEVLFVLEDLNVPIECVCSCIKDHGQEECADLMSSCRGGVYLEVPDVYSERLYTVSNIVKRRQ